MAWIQLCRKLLLLLLLNNDLKVPGIFRRILDHLLMSLLVGSICCSGKLLGF